MIILNTIIFIGVVVVLIRLIRRCVWSKIVFKYHMIKLFFFLRRARKELPEDLQEQAKQGETIVKNSILNDSIFDKDK